MRARDARRARGRSRSWSAGCVHREVLPERPARYAETCRTAAPRGRGAARGARASIGSTRTRPRRSTRCATGTSVVVATGTASGKSLCYQVPIVVVGRRRAARHRAAPLPHQGARPGSAALAALVARARACARSPTTATPPATIGRGRARTRTSCSPIPRCCTWGSSRRTSAGRRSSCGCTTSSSTSCTRCAASSAATSRTCCAGCAASASTTARSPRSSSRARRSAIPASSRARCAGSTVEQIVDDASPRAERVLALLATTAPRRALRRARVRRTSRPRELLDPLRARRATRRSRSRAAGAAPRSSRSTRGAASPMRCEPDARRDSRRGVPGRVPARGTARARAASSSSGRLLGIAATNALELGIDIGGLDAVVLNGFPGTLASMWQQAGRAGRTGRRSAAVLVAGDDQLDQWYAAHPRELTRRAARARGRQPAEPVHRARAGRVRGERDAAHARRRTLVRRRARRRGARARARRPARSRAAARCTGRGERPPAREVGLRSGSSIEYRLVDRESERTIGTVDDARVFAVAHPGAVYLHQGRQYRVERARPATITSRSSSRTTTPTSTRRRAPTTDITIVSEDAFAPLGDAIVHLGRGRGPQSGRRVPAQADLDQRRDRGVRSRPAGARAGHARVLVHGPARGRRGGRHRHRRSSSARCTPPNTG